MFQMRKNTNRNLGNVAKPLMLTAAVVGWGAFAYSALSLTEVKRQLHGQAAVLQDYQLRYQQERQASAKARAQIGPLQEQLASAHDEVERLSKSQSELTADLTRVKAQLQSAQQLLDEQAQAAVIHVPPRPTERDVMAAQEALTQLHFGSIKADGVIGPDTRHAIEEFQRAAGLTVTGQLHAQTLQSLLRMAKVVTALEEHGQAVED